MSSPDSSLPDPQMAYAPRPPSGRAAPREMPHNSAPRADVPRLSISGMGFTQLATPQGKVYGGRRPSTAQSHGNGGRSFRHAAAASRPQSARTFRPATARQASGRPSSARSSLSSARKGKLVAALRKEQIVNAIFLKLQCGSSSDATKAVS